MNVFFNEKYNEKIRKQKQTASEKPQRLNEWILIVK